MEVQSPNHWTAGEFPHNEANLMQVTTTCYMPGAVLSVFYLLI